MHCQLNEKQTEPAQIPAGIRNRHPHKILMYAKNLLQQQNKEKHLRCLISHDIKNTHAEQRTDKKS